MTSPFDGIRRTRGEAVAPTAKPLTVELLQKMAEMIRQASVKRCGLCHSTRGLCSMVLVGHGIDWICQDCIAAGRVVEVS